jgi:SAM-dependent methyltransferase
MNNYYNTRYTFDNNRSKVWKAICEFIQRYVKNDSNVLELGSGYCDFINNIKAQNKKAIDIDSQSNQYCNKDVEFTCIDISQNISYSPENTIDFVFLSNVLEHFDDARLNQIFLNINKCLKKGGRIGLLQPNYKYCSKDYFDDYTHIKVFSHISLINFLEANDFKIIKAYPRFIPFSFKSRLPKSYFLTKLYLMSAYRPFAKQMLIIAEKK